MNEIDELRLYRGGEYELPNKVKIHCPTLGEICDYGEKQYMSMISVFTATTIDRCAQLEDMGIDYTAITNFQMFLIFKDLLRPDKDEDGFTVLPTRILFGDLDFHKFKFAENNGELCMINNEGIVFDEAIFDLMASYIRKMHGIPEPLYTTVKNDFAKKQLILDARNDAKFHEKMRAFKGDHSQYQPFISALVNHPNFKYNWHTVWDVSVNAFFDSLKRISIIENANHLYTGLYSGCIEYDKIKKDLDWLKPIN